MANITSAVEGRRPLRVTVGDLAPSPMVGYADQVIGDQVADVEFTFFVGSYRYPDVDVVHFHDVDGFLGGRKKVQKERVAAATAIVDHAQSNGVALVRTVLDSSSSPGDPAVEILDQATSRFIVLDQATATPDSDRTTVVPHAHYRDRFLGYPRGEQVPGRLLCIARAGVARSAVGPLKVFSVTDTSDLSLRVVGAPDPALESLLPRAIARNRDTVSARTEMLSDAEMIREIDGAELVILPAVESLADMGLLFTVLSMDRPVLTPDGATVRQLSEEVGSGWIQRYREPITAESIDEAVGALRKSSRPARPDLKGRAMSSTGQAYAEVYREANSQTDRSHLE